MRVLFITRTHPRKTLGPLEMRLHGRLTELSELGHDVLVLTKWTGDPIDFDLPKRIEIRSPFTSFRPWEWARALPMVFAWRPELLHVFDPGLSAIERTLSVELMAMTMMETLKRASRGRSPFLGSLVSLAAGNESSPGAEGWKKAGVKFVEQDWLHASAGDRISVTSWDEARDRRLRIALAGVIGSERPLQHVLDALDFMRTNSDFELTVFLDRARLSKRDRAELGHAERREAFGSAVGSRLVVVSPPLKESGPDTISPARGPKSDVAILAGLDEDVARRWIERLSEPMIMSEKLKPLINELQRLGVGSKRMGPLVSEIAPVTQALQLAVDRRKLSEAWLKIEHGALDGGRDFAANQVSRLYSQIAGTNSTS